MPVTNMPEDVAGIEIQAGPVFQWKEEPNQPLEAARCARASRTDVRQ